jgi:hypothetical protein
VIVQALGACHPDCRFCAREFWRWYAGRMLQMHKVNARGRSRGETSFAQAAATSIGARCVRSP